MKNIKKVCLNSLSFLDNNIINSIIVIVLVLYSSGIFENINYFIGNIYNYSIVRLLIILLIIYLSYKDTTVAILLTLSYLVSLHYMRTSEYFYGGKEHFGGGLMVGPGHFEPTPNQGSIEKMGMTDPMGNNMNKSMDKSKDMQPIIQMRGPMMNSSKMAMKDPMEKKEKFFNFGEIEIPENVNYNSVIDEELPIKIDSSNTNVNSNVNMNNSLPKSACLDMYDPRFESVSDVCSPIATYKNEFNAQGLNFPEGYDVSNLGAPL